MNMLEKAREEMKLAGIYPSADELQKPINDFVLYTIAKFADMGHSGSSATYTIRLLTKLLEQKPLRALTGDDDEWEEVSPGLWQNKREASIFKTCEGAYDLDGIIFEDQNGCQFSNSNSRVPVEFPYTCKVPQVIKVFVNKED